MKTKKFTALLLSLAMLLSGFGAPAFADEPNGYSGDIVLASHGVTLRTSAGSIPADSEFVVTEDKGRITDYMLSCLTGFAKAPQYIRAYSLSLTHNGERVTPLYDVTVEFPIPEGWDLNTISAYRETYAAGKNNPSSMVGMLGSIGTVDKATGRLKFTRTKNPEVLNASILILDRGTPLDIAALALEDGLYKAKVTMGHDDTLNQMSMSSASIVDNTGYIEVKDGIPTLFLEVAPIYNVNIWGYLSDLKLMAEPSNYTTKIAASKYEYYANTDGTLDVDWLAVEDGVRYPKRLSMPLLETCPDKSYRVQPVVAIMDALAGHKAGSGGATVYARLRILDLEKIEGENPLSGYDKSALRAKIEEAQSVAGEEGSAIASAIASAWSVYDVNPDSASVETAIKALAAAMGEEAAAPLPVVKTALQDKIAEAESYNGKYYTAGSFAGLQTVIASAKETLNSSAAAQADVNAQMRALDAAVAGLVGTGAAIDKTDLSERLDEAKVLQRADYTQESYAVLQTAIAAAELAVADGGASQITIDACLYALNGAIDSLVELRAGLYEMTAWRLNSASDPKINTAASAAFQAAPAKVRLLGDDMAVTLFLQGYNDSATGQTVFIQEIARPAGLYAGVVESIADAQGHLTEASFTIPYTEQPFQIRLIDNTGTSNTAVLLDFATAVSAEESLAEKIAAAEGISLGDYTEDSYAELRTAIVAAKAVSTDDESAADAQKAALDKALNSLAAKIADKTPLADLIKEADEIDQSQYVSFTALPFRNALSEVKNVLYDPDATRQVQIDSALQNLRAAIAGLVKNQVNKNYLTNTVNSAKGYQQQYYTDESFSTLQAAITAAESLLNDPDATQTQLDAQVNDLRSAIETLEFRSGTLDKGVYEIPFQIRTAINGVAMRMGAAFAPAKIKVVGDSMTVTLYAVQPYSINDTEYWITQLSSLPDLPNVTVRNIVDEQGHLTEATFAIPFTTSPFRINLNTTQNDGNCWLFFDFENASLLDEIVDSAYKDALTEKIIEAETIAQSDYTEESYNALQYAIDTAKAVLNSGDATQAAVDAALGMLRAAISALEADAAVVGVVYEIPLMFTTSAGSTTRTIISDAFAPAKVNVNGDNMTVTMNATQSYANSSGSVYWVNEFVDLPDLPGTEVKNTIDEQGHLVKAVFTVPYTTSPFPINIQTTQKAATYKLYLVLDFDNAVKADDEPEPPVVDTDALTAKITEAEAVTQGDYTDDSFAALTSAIATAKAMLTDADATQEQINAQVTALEAAIAALEAQAAFGGDGTYTMPVQTKDSASAATSGSANAAFQAAPARVTVSGDNMTVTLYMQSFVFNSVTNWITRLLYFNDTSIPVETIADENGYLTEATFTIPFTTDLFIIRVQRSDKSYINQYLVLDFDNAVKADDEPEPPVVDTDALTAKITEAEAVTQGDYTDDSFAALTSAIATAKAMLTDADATQEQINAQVTALEAAIAALEAQAAFGGDGTYTMPVQTKDSASAATSGSANAAFQAAPARVTVSGDNMTVTLYMQSFVFNSVTNWIKGLAKPTNNANIPVESIADDNGYLTEATFTIPFTKDPIYVSVTRSGSAYAFNQYLVLDFDSAVKADDEPEPPVVDTTALTAKIAEAEAVTQGDYTDDSFAALTSAIATAKAVLAAADATQEQINAQVTALQFAVNGLTEKTPDIPDIPDTSSLSALISVAETYTAANGAGYEPVSYQALVARIAAAKAVLADDGRTETLIALQTTALNAETDALIAESDLTSGEPSPIDISNLEEGTYTISTLLRKYAENINSMGNNAINHSLSKLIVDGNGNTRIYLYFQPLTASLGNLEFVGYLKTLKAVTSFEYGEYGDIISAETEDAIILSQYDVTDDYGNEYPKELTLPVTNVGESAVYVQVFVPVMDYISPGSGSQYARLMLDWSTLAREEEDNVVTPDYAALNSAISQAFEADSTDYTSESYAALTASKAAGEALLILEGATQTMANARTAAITAAIAALIPATGDDTPDPEEPTVPAGSVTLGLKGASSVKVGNDVVYEVTVANTANLGNLTFKAETTGGLTLKNVTALGGANLYSGANESDITLGFLESGLTSTGETAVLRLTFTANTSGNANVTLTDISASGIVIGENGNPNSYWYDVNGTYTFGVTVKDDLAFDINGDDKEDMLDLTLAQYYYQLTSASPQWDARAAKADQNGDGKIDLGDLIEIYIAVKAAS